MYTLFYPVQVKLSIFEKIIFMICVILPDFLGMIFE